MELRKKVHLKLKNIDIKIKLTKHVIGIAILLLSACDFRLPQKWDTPSWELPLSIPLYNGSITMFDLIDTTGSDLTLDTLGNYSIDTSLVMIYQPCPELDEDNFDPSDICCVESLPGYNPFDENCPVRVNIDDEYFNVGLNDKLLEGAQVSGGSRAIELGLITLKNTKSLGNKMLFLGLVFLLLVMSLSYLNTGSSHMYSVNLVL